MNYNFIDDYSGSGEFYDRPDVVGPIQYNTSNPAQFLNLNYSRCRAISWEILCWMDLRTPANRVLATTET